MNLFKQISHELKAEGNKGNKSITPGKSKSKSDKNMKIQIHTKSIDDNDKNKKNLEECWYFTNRQCKYRDDCNKLKDICTDIKTTGICRNKDCDLGHPELCDRLLTDGRCNNIDASTCIQK